MATSRTRHGTVPKLSQEPGTSATEWAKETEGAIAKHSSGKPTDMDRSNVTTPGYELPGAFPMDSTSEGSKNSAHLGDTANKTVEGAYVTNHDNIQSVYTTAEQAVRQYLPESVVDKLEGVGVLRENPEYQDKGTLSTQPLNFTPTHDGVSSLPRSKDEVGATSAPTEKKEEQVTESRDIAAVPETESRQSNYKPSQFSSTTPNSPPKPSRSPVSDSEIATGTVNSNTNPFIARQSNSNKPNADTFESSHSPAIPSASSTPVSRTGTPTSPDSDAQAAAQVRRDEMGRGERTSTGSGTGDRLRTATESNINGGSNKGNELQAEEGSARYDTSHEDSQTIKNTDSSHIHGGDGVEGKQGVISHGKGANTRKSLFIQKLKGEVKTIVEKLKTKTKR